MYVGLKVDIWTRILGLNKKQPGVLYIHRIVLPPLGLLEQPFAG